MSNMQIDSEALNAEITKLEAITLEMQDLLSRIQSDTDSLKDCWSTRTSEGVYNDFNMFYKLLENAKATNEQDSKFLKNVVSSNYVSFENKTNTLVDDNIAI